MRFVIAFLASFVFSCSDGGTSPTTWGGQSQYFTSDISLHSRAYHSMCVVDSKVYVFGGFGMNLISNALQAFNSGWYYSPSDEQIYAIEEDEQSPRARQKHQCSVIEDLLFIWGGLSAAGAPLKSGSFYDPKVKNWTQMPTANAHAQTHSQSQVAVQQNLITWGGSSIAVNSGARYDFETNLWNVLPSDDPPEARTKHSTVATNTSMIIWGGMNGNEYFDNGYVYSLADNSWRKIDGKGAPSGRSEHTAIWTGEKMIIWGGRNSESFLKDGGLYDPIDDTWEPITDAVIDGRVEHVAVWAKGYMIIWGGTTTDGVSNTGAVYHYKTDSWVEIGDFGLTPRVGHRAAWTGEYLVIYGGWDGPYKSFGPTGNKYRNDGVRVKL